MNIMLRDSVCPAILNVLNVHMILIYALHAFKDPLENYPIALVRPELEILDHIPRSVEIVKFLIQVFLYLKIGIKLLLILDTRYIRIMNRF